MNKPFASSEHSGKVVRNYIKEGMTVSFIFVRDPTLKEWQIRNPDLCSTVRSSTGSIKKDKTLN